MTARLRIRRRAWLLWTLSLLCGLLITAGASAQFQIDESSEPIVVEADNGIEWFSESEKFVAQGNAVANRGENRVFADTLTAFYRETEQTETEIYRIEARGNVTIEAPGRTATGDHAVYNLDEALVTLQGQALSFVTDDGMVTARDSLEYWSQRRLAVARGDAVATEQARTIRADTLTAQFEETADGKLNAVHMEAIGGVVITTPKDTAKGDKGVYNVKQQIATLSGNVEITRGESKLNGGFAEIDLDTGNSHLLPDPADGNRVKGVFVQQPKSETRGE